MDQSAIEFHVRPKYLKRRYIRNRVLSHDQYKSNADNDCHDKYYPHSISTAWLKFLNLTFAFNIINAFSIRCSLKVHVPNKNDVLQVSRLILRIPILCKHSVMYTMGVIIQQSNYLWTYDESITQSLKQRPDYSKKGRQTDFSEDTTKGRKWGSATITNYIRSLKWTPIPLSVGFLLLAYQHWRRVVRRVESENPTLAKDWEITCYSSIPLRSLSRAWGWINSVDLPVFCREPFFKWYAKKFNCDCSEAACTDLHEYKNLGEFFRRSLKDGLRPVDDNSPIVSPADGKILHFGKVDSECGFIEQVKGVSYSLPAFLGLPTWTEDLQSSNYIKNEKYCHGIMTNPEKNSLYHCVIYLAPGDYHRFHSPADWEVQYRRHFSGELMSVNPTIARWIGGLFSLNERAVYYGKWKHGFFSMTAVGATNVGSIRVYEDEDLHTNHRSMKKRTSMDKRFEKPLHFNKGDAFGEFNLGSTIVIIFEAPSNFTCSAQERIKFGKSLYTANS